MARVRERDEIRDMLTESERQAVVVPSPDEVRALVEGPPRRRQLRWMRWLGAFVALLLAASVTALLLGGSTAEPEPFAGNATQLPAGVPVDGTAWESVVVRPASAGNPTQLPAGAELDGTVWESAVVLPAYPGNPTQLPEGVGLDDVAWQAAVVLPAYPGTATQLPAGSESGGPVWEAAVVLPVYPGNPTQLPAGAPVDGTVWDGMS